MRVLFAIVLLSVAASARAADLSIRYPGGELGYRQRSEMVWYYDDQPGVVVRAYWSAPWHNHHYYPFSGVRPRVGRRENLSAVSRPSKPPPSYRRTWNNNWAFEHAPVILPGNEVVIGNVDASVYRGSKRHRPYVGGHGRTQVH